MNLRPRHFPIALLHLSLGVCLLLLTPSSSQAQQDWLTTQWAYNKLSVNPGYAGAREILSIRALHRQQWVGVAGRPMTTVVNAHSPLVSKDMGLGITYVHDQLGVINSHYMSISYAYGLPFRNNTRLAFGMNGGFQALKIHTAQLDAVHPADPLIQQDLGRMMPRFGAGVYYCGDRFYAGISVPNLVPNRMYRRDDVSPVFDDGSSQQVIHIYGMAGYALVLADGAFVLKPQVLFKSAASRNRSAPFQADFNLSFDLYEIIFAGATFRTTFANKNDRELENAAGADIILGCRINKTWFVSYSYDFTLGELNSFDSGSHEILFGVDLDLRRSGVYSPRMF